MGVNVFSPEQLAKVVAEALPADGSAKKRAVVGRVNEDGVQVVGSFRWKNGKWQLVGAARHDWDGDNSVGIGGMITW